MVVSILALMMFQAQAAPPCDEEKGFHEVFGTCYLMNVWDFTLTDTSSRIDFTSFGEGTEGGGEGVGAVGPSPGPSADAGPDPSPGPSGDAGGGGGDSGDAGDGPGGCAY